MPKQAMARAIQKRTLETRAKLIGAANAVIDEVGFDGLRVEHVVARAGVAKGTFFAHFADKDVLMDQLIGARINAHLDRIEDLPAPQNVGDLTLALIPLLTFMSCERYVFDVILRHSGAAARQEIGPIAMTFERQARVIAQWLAAGPCRRDVDVGLLAEGVQAFAVQAMALNFCAVHNDVSLHDRLRPYLAAWLMPSTQPA